MNRLTGNLTILKNGAIQTTRVKSINHKTSTVRRNTTVFTRSTKESKVTVRLVIEDLTMRMNVHLLHTRNNNYYPVCGGTFMQEVICIPIHPLNGTLAESATGFSFAISLSLAIEPRLVHSIQQQLIQCISHCLQTTKSIYTRLGLTQYRMLNDQFRNVRVLTSNYNLRRARLTIQYPNVAMQEERRGHSARRKLFQDDDDSENQSGDKDNIVNRFYEEARKNRENAKERWNFDFEKEEPLPGRYEWVKLDQDGNEISTPLESCNRVENLRTMQEEDTQDDDVTMEEHLNDKDGENMTDST